MKTSGKVLLKRYAALGHEEITIHVDWEGLDKSEIELLASFYVQDRCCQELRSSDRKLPQSVTVYAADYLHREKVEEKPVNVPESWKSGTDKKPKQSEKEKLKSYLATLSQEELAILISE